MKLKTDENKNTRKELRKLLKEAAIDLFPRFLASMKTLDDKDFAKMYIDMMNYVIPKIQSIALDDNGEAVTGVEHLRQISGWNKDNEE